MYTHTNYKTKKALKADVAAGVKVTVFQPGPSLSAFGQALKDGVAYLEGPHFPEPHRWYAQIELRDGLVIRVK